MYLRIAGVYHCKNALINEMLLIVPFLSQYSVPFICSQNAFLF